MSDSESEAESETSAGERQEMIPSKTRASAGNSKAKGVRQPSTKGVCLHVHYLCVLLQFPFHQILSY